MLALVLKALTVKLPSPTFARGEHLQRHRCVFALCVCKGTAVCDRDGAQAATVRHLMHTTAREHFHSRVEEHVCDALMCDMVVWRCVTQGASCIVPHTGHGHTVLCVTRLRPAG